MVKFHAVIVRGACIANAIAKEAPPKLDGHPLEACALLHASLSPALASLSREQYSEYYALINRAQQMLGMSHP